MARKGTTSEQVLYFMQQLQGQNRIPTRQVLADLLGVKLAVVDDHLKRMKDDGKIRSPVNGVFEIVTAAPPPRPVSATFLPDGAAKIEMGDQLLECHSAAEVELLAIAVSGIFARYGFTITRN